MISRKITAAIAGVAVIGALGGGALALANDGGPAAPPSVTARTTGSDDGTADQGHGDAPGTQTGNDDGTADQGHGDAPGTQTGNDDGTADQGHGDARGTDDGSGHDAHEDRSGHGGPGRG
jgi:hypothetical protein